MARLYDRLMVSGFDDWGDSPPELIVADNVAEYWFDVMPDEWSLGDFPNIAPPFDQTFVEFRIGGVARKNWDPRLPVEWGVSLAAIPTSQPDIADILPALFASMRTEASAVKWIYLATLFSHHNAKDSLVPGTGPVGCHAWIPVGPSGAIPDGAELAGTFDPDRWDENEAIGGLSKLVWPALLALTFMHCKNVQRREVVQPAFDRQLWQRKHKRPLVRYHVLDIDPMRKVLRTEGRSDEVGLKKALHICRGHFATYTDEAPLFGKVTGTFWKSQHVRGSAKNGAVVKDYRIKC